MHNHKEGHQKNPKDTRKSILVTAGTRKCKKEMTAVGRADPAPASLRASRAVHALGGVHPEMHLDAGTHLETRLEAHLDAGTNLEAHVETRPGKCSRVSKRALWGTLGDRGRCRFRRSRGALAAAGTAPVSLLLTVPLPHPSFPSVSAFCRCVCVCARAGLTDAGR
jgi:hypothetical protein